MSKGTQHKEFLSRDAAKTWLDAGLKVFSQKGFSAARLEDIAREARLTRGAFYWHFRYKLELFLGIFSGKLDELHAETQALLQSGTAPYETLRDFILYVPAKILEDDNFYAFGKLRYKIEWTDGLEEAAMKPFLEKQAKNNNRELIRLLGVGKKSGAFRRELAAPVVSDMIEIVFRAWHTSC